MTRSKKPPVSVFVFVFLRVLIHFVLFCFDLFVFLIIIQGTRTDENMEICFLNKTGSAIFEVCKNISHYIVAIDCLISQSYCQKALDIQTLRHLEKKQSGRKYRRTPCQKRRCTDIRTDGPTTQKGIYSRESTAEKYDEPKIPRAPGTRRGRQNNTERR